MLGIIVENPNFPTAVTCPVCNEPTLHIYDDMVRDDLWLACTGCPAHGNIITFGAQIWKIDAIKAIERFRELKVNTREPNDDELATLLKAARVQQAAENFWSTVSGQLWDHGDDVLNLKFRDFGLSPEIPCEGMVGVATAAQLAEICSQLWVAFPRRMKSKRPFLIFPYYDMPKHFTGFLVTQYLEEFDIKRVFLPTAVTKHSATDAGYFLLDTALLKNPSVRDAQFIVDDPQWVLKAQTTQLRHGNPLLPICASYSGAEAISQGLNWQGTSRARRFFYGRTITPELISQAANGRGYICPVQSDGLPRPKVPAKTLKILGQLCRAAVTWQKTLAHIFQTTNEVALQNFAARLFIANDKLRSFFANHNVVSEDTAAQLIAKTNPVFLSAPESTAYFNNIVVRDGCWFTPRGLVIVNCVPVIEQVIYAEDKKYYAGYVKKQNKQVPFIELARRIEKIGLLEYASRLMAAQGEVVVFTPAWNKRSHVTAMTLRSPEIVHTRTKPGWDEQTREFYCARYSITHTGDVKPVPYPELNKVKAFNLPDPSGTAPISIYNLLTPAHEHSFVWLVFSAAMANALAPALNCDQTSSCITAETFLAAREILTALGIKHTELRSVNASIKQTIVELARKADWPIAISVTGLSDKFFDRAFVKHPNKAPFLRINAVTTTSAISYGWQVITGQPPAPGADYSALPFVAAAYIQRALRNRMRLATANKSLTHAVLADLHTWLNETYGQTFNLSHAEKQLILPGQEHITLMVELNRAIEAEDIAIIPRARTWRQPHNYVIRNKENWWLNRKAIDGYFNMVSGTPPNWLALADCFSRHGLLRGEKTINAASGLLVDRAWCDKFWTDYGDAAAKNIG